ncbi:unnamed protein product [Auanema sp. JU1783]|nr:unnamed protein product [Auanema sp. JU1783]
MEEHSKRRVAYYYDGNIGNYYYGQGHVMKPNRIRMTHHLILNYGIYRDLEVYRPYPASFEDMTVFHSEEYVQFLKCANPDNLRNFKPHMLKFNVGEDCPVFDGLYEFCQLSSGASIAAAVKLNKNKTDIAINWMGGLHHAKKGEASGFCYTNDIVLAILELLKHNKRVLYVDIDVHHGDGVEEAFFTTDRVMTVSFHKYGEFFPGTGDFRDIGAGKGKNYAVNIPLREGITDEAYQSIFKPIMTKVMERFQPCAVVLQCGADSLAGDRLGPFNLTLRGHGECVSFFRKYNIPLMLVGGGGYTPRNVARCWAYETSLATNKEIPNEIPYNDYFEFYAPHYKLHLAPLGRANMNSVDFMQFALEKVMDNLNSLAFVPSVQMQPLEEDFQPPFNDPTVLSDYVNPDSRLHPSIMESLTDDVGEYYDGEQEGDDRRNEYNAKRSAERNDSKGSPVKKCREAHGKV